jgi:hypothetical protein
LFFLQRLQEQLEQSERRLSEEGEQLHAASRIERELNERLSVALVKTQQSEALSATLRLQIESLRSELREATTAVAKLTSDLKFI